MRNFTYTRRCHRCGEFFDAVGKHSKVCPGCYKKKGGVKVGNKGGRIPLVLRGRKNEERRI